ncbi:hypothetical protein E2C01_021108 [Portunus trituberculatus]|uniref:Uncharacterized protein n=1 Tax=Portunus trituberculatus TaxID=210409 RepID=A0A5B7E2D3_PORTR|nr:hypothetical protein [Portunus trituberculatus]
MAGRRSVRESSVSVMGKGWESGEMKGNEEEKGIRERNDMGEEVKLRRFLCSLSLVSAECR